MVQALFKRWILTQLCGLNTTGCILRMTSKFGTKEAKLFTAKLRKNKVSNILSNFRNLDIGNSEEYFCSVESKHLIKYPASANAIALALCATGELRRYDYVHVPFSLLALCDVGHLSTTKSSRGFLLRYGRNPKSPSRARVSKMVRGQIRVPRVIATRSRSPTTVIIRIKVSWYPTTGTGTLPYQQ